MSNDTISSRPTTLEYDKWAVVGYMPHEKEKQNHNYVNKNDNEKDF